MSRIFALHVATSMVSVALGAELECEPGTDMGGYEERYRWVVAEVGSERVVAAQIRILRERERTVNGLVSLVQTPIPEGNKAIAMRLLGESRAAEAVRPLIAQIGFTSLFGRHGDALTKYPAALALRDIGQPAVRVILRDRLRLPASEEELRLFARVVQGHYALESPVGRFHVQHMLELARQEIQGHKDPPKYLVRWESNLKRLLELYDTIEHGELAPGAFAP